MEEFYVNEKSTTSAGIEPVTFRFAAQHLNHRPTAVILIFFSIEVKVKVKFSRYKPGVAQRVDRGIALLFHDRGTRSG